MKAKKSWTSIITRAFLMLGFTPAIAGPPTSSDEDYTKISSKEVDIDQPDTPVRVLNMSLYPVDFRTLRG